VFPPMNIVISMKGYGFVLIWHITMKIITTLRNQIKIDKNVDKNNKKSKVDYIGYFI